METMRTRAKENLPHVLLTLLSIIQALALELYWSRLQVAGHLLELSLTGATYWLQAAASFFGILVIWVVYATNLMRFRWVPGISDSVLPFFVGLLQFIQIESLGPGRAGIWTLCLALIFALMNTIAYLIMRQARRDPDNAAFFSRVDPASLKDFYGAAALVSVFAATGAYLIVVPESPVITALAMLAALAALGWTMWGVTYFWRWTMTGDGGQD